MLSALIQHYITVIIFALALQSAAEYDGQVEDVPEDAISQGQDFKAALLSQALCCCMQLLF